MDEYLTESEQWERLKAWLRENWPWLAAGIGLGVLALWGWRWWEARTERLALEASAKYQQVLDAYERGDRTRGLTLLDELRRDYGTSPYTDQAELATARVHVEQNELDKAGERLRRVMETTDDPQLALVARLRLARVQVAQNRPDDALATLTIAEPGAFAPRFHEVRGDALLAKGDRAKALEAYLTARAGDVAAVVDTALLDLKINDLRQSQPAVAGETKSGGAAPQAADAAAKPSGS